MERVVQDQAAEGNEEEEEEENNKDKANTSEANKNLWFRKISPMVDYVCKVSKSLIFCLGTILSLDEMMIRFSGRSLQTHRVKNKPIGEGYKFFVLATSSGFIVNFTPDGQTAKNKQEQEYEDDKSMGKVQTMILFIFQSVERLKNERQIRLREMMGRKTRSSRDDIFLTMKIQ